jgi:tetratricopeptide (TPR) repeat protein
MRIRTLLLSILFASIAAQTIFAEQKPPTPTTTDEHAARHAGTDWDLIAPHLPDPATATAHQLEVAGDVLKARRFPEDALEYYHYAIARGGNEEALLKRMGVIRLDLQQNQLARALFVRSVHLSKKDAMAWNNLGATDYSMGAYGLSISEYKRALKLDKNSAVFHANLGMSYFEEKDMDEARKQFAIAMHLDPTIMENHGSGGITLRILQSQDYGRLCFEMAKTYAKRGQPEETKIWLQKASEHGLDLRAAMNEDSDLRPWLKDPEVRLMLQNTERLHKRVATTTLPTLGTASDSSVPN